MIPVNVYVWVNSRAQNLLATYCVCAYVCKPMCVHVCASVCACVHVHTCIMRAVGIIVSDNIPLGTTPCLFCNNHIQSIQMGLTLSLPLGWNKLSQLANQSPSQDLFFRTLPKDSAVFPLGFFLGFKQKCLVLQAVHHFAMRWKEPAWEEAIHRRAQWRQRSPTDIPWAPGSSYAWSSHLGSQWLSWSLIPFSASGNTNWVNWRNSR